MKDKILKQISEKEASEKYGCVISGPNSLNKYYLRSDGCVVDDTGCVRYIPKKLDVCPVCGAHIEPKDGEDNGHGELHLYWTCKECNAHGKAIIDQQDHNTFVEHEID